MCLKLTNRWIYWLKTRKNTFRSSDRSMQNSTKVCHDGFWQQIHKCGNLFNRSLTWWGGVGSWYLQYHLLWYHLRQTHVWMHPHHRAIHTSHESVRDSSCFQQDMGGWNGIWDLAFRNPFARRMSTCQASWYWPCSRHSGGHGCWSVEEPNTQIKQLCFRWRAL